MSIGGRVRGAAFAVAAIGGVVLATPAPADAHPLDVYLQASYVTVTSSGIDVELDLSPGTQVAGRVIDDLDTNGDRVFQEAEGLAFARRAVAVLGLSLDGTSLPVRIDDVVLPTYKATVAGYGTIKITTSSTATVTPGHHTVSYTNGSTVTKSVFQANAFLQDGLSASVGTQERNANQSRLTFPVTITGTQAPTSPRRPGGGPATTNAIAIGATAVALGGAALPLRRSIERRRARAG